MTRELQGAYRPVSLLQVWGLGRIGEHFWLLGWLLHMPASIVDKALALKVGKAIHLSELFLFLYVKLH
jgi:hypothetical protein